MQGALGGMGGIHPLTCTTAQVCTGAPSHFLPAFTLRAGSCPWSWGRMLFVLCCELMNSQAEPWPAHVRHQQINK